MHAALMNTRIFDSRTIVADVLHWVLFGTLTVQFYLYYKAFPNDRLANKYLVYALYVLELIQTILTTHSMFVTFGVGFSDPEALMNMDFGWLAVPIMSGLGNTVLMQSHTVALIGQSFYAYRVYLLSCSPFIPTLIITVAIASSVGAFFVAACTFEGLLGHLWLIGSALADIVIAICMTHYLSKYDTKFRQTRAVLSKLTRLIIETGSVTASITLVTLALFYAFPDKSYYSPSAMIIPALYTNTILAVLNSRFQILGGRGMGCRMELCTRINHPGLHRLESCRLAGDWDGSGTPV
ncbi:hypothetical protein DFH08DRAFT_945856 [Mycena albidolilacea]|uniref:DUF6534 domain-containing protein n=1 Tax=Mycena albidolilacea TaxID=1033008 RepID=A0AAD7E8C4_9AGAR|nr:hypothetical protein DFH08DRAFT_945856 [Mycena albidolilacea]